MILYFCRALILYASLIIVVRLMGKRQVGEMEPVELVVAMLIADLAAVSMQDTGITLFAGLVPIFTILAAEILLSALTFYSTKLQKLLCGKPVILMENGKYLYPNMKKTRVSVNELTAYLRENGVLNPATVKYAILETDGSISVIRYPKHEPASAKDAGVKVADVELPVAVIISGKWQEENLLLSGFTRHWVEQQLRHYNCAVNDVLLLSVVSSGIVYLARKDEP